MYKKKRQTKKRVLSILCVPVFAKVIKSLVDISGKLKFYLLSEHFGNHRSLLRN